MIFRWMLIPAVLLTAAVAAEGQTASIGQRVKQAREREQGSAKPTGLSNRETPVYEGNEVLEGSSLIAVPVKPPKVFKRHDIITIIVRHAKKFEAEGDIESKKRFEGTSELDAFINFTDGGIGAANFRRGKPNVDYQFETRLKNEGDNTREDTFITRVSGFIVDVKPNGNLVIEAKARIRHEEEDSLVTLTGEVRSADVTPDNTVLSTQIANLDIEVDNKGAVRDAATRGWVTRLLDILKPI